MKTHKNNPLSEEPVQMHARHLTRENAVNVRIVDYQQEFGNMLMNGFDFDFYDGPKLPDMD